MVLSKIQAESMNLADTYAFTGTVSGAGGITEADQWRVASSFTGNADPISSNWERNDNSGFSYLGTGMTQSSGIFTFPSTGIWLIRFQGAGYATSTNSQAIRFYISTTTNNSTYTQAAHSASGLYNFGSGLETMVSCYAETMFDVTSTSTHKVRFSFGAGQGPEGLYGDSTKNFTSVTFVRIGDT